MIILKKEDVSDLLPLFSFGGIAQLEENIWELVAILLDDLFYLGFAHTINLGVINHLVVCCQVGKQIILDPQEFPPLGQLLELEAR